MYKINAYESIFARTFSKRYDVMTLKHLKAFRITTVKLLV